MKVYYKLIHYDRRWRPLEYVEEDVKFCCEMMENYWEEPVFSFPEGDYSKFSPFVCLRQYSWEDWESVSLISFCPFCGTEIKCIETGVYKEEKTIHHVMEKVEKVKTKLVKVND